MSICLQRWFKMEVYFMAFSYDKLWKLMIDKKINKTTLRKAVGISSNAMAKLGKNEPVNIAILAKICQELNCSVDDIMEIVPDK